MAPPSIPAVKVTNSTGQGRYPASVIKNEAFDGSAANHSDVLSLSAKLQMQAADARAAAAERGATISSAQQETPECSDLQEYMLVEGGREDQEIKLQDEAQ